MARILVGIVCLALAAPSAAFAADTNAPPGNSEVGEYLETVPGADGNKPTRGLQGGKPATPAFALGRRNAQRLEALGASGRAAAQAAAASAPSPGQTRNSGSQRSSGASSKLPSAAPDAGSPSIFKALKNGVDGSASGGLGFGLPLILLASTLAAMVLAVRQRRTS